ncbi:MAG TPA: beta-propeller domain-containing protein [Gaiellaceae bacterium]|nr:beta-propeller domain-containing protein [Gaiellaceae bacterium]
MAVRGRLAMAATAAVVLGSTLAASAPAASGGGRLVAFSSCADLLSYVRARSAPFVTAYGLGQRIGITAVPRGLPTTAPATGATPQQGIDYSGTNVQEAGVDEPDIVKTNGKTLFAVENGRLEAVDVSGARPKLLDTLQLDNGWSHELLLSGTHLLVLSRGGYWIQPLPARPASLIMPPIPATSSLTEVDVSNPAALKVARRLKLDGAYVDARMVGSTVRVVSSSGLPIALPTVTPTDGSAAAVAAAKAKNAAVVASSGVRAWLPTYRLGKLPARPLVSCRRIRRPARFSGLGMLTVTTIDLAKGLAPVDSTAVMTDGRIVYASPSRLYVATEPWTIRPLPATPNVVPSVGQTQIHSFDISDPAKTTYLGSGTVPGFLLSQWSLSEFQGVLRVVSTDTPAWLGSGPESETFLTTLRPQNGSLAQVGQLGGLGRGERVYAVRMIGDTAYVVTFRQVDPLFTVDLGDPAHPRLLGQLELPGYSSYLHPISAGLLLGIGQDVDPQTNRPGGTQVSLFDVSDPRHPVRLRKATLGQGWSAAESDHHAFLYWPATGLVVVPFGQQAVALHVSRSVGIDELGRIVHTRAQQAQLPQLDRSVVVRNSLLTVSSAGVASNGLTGLASLGWAPFPAPAPPVPVPLPGAPSQP